MTTHYLVADGEIIAQGARTDLEPLATSNRHVVFAPDWDLGITGLQDPDCKILDLLRETFADDEPVDMERWQGILARLK